MHPWLGAHAPWLLSVHVLATLAFAAMHTPSIVAMWRLRATRDPPVIRALLTRSRQWSFASTLALLALGLSGVALASAQHAWRAPWVWSSAIVFVAVGGAMSPLATRPFNEARSAAGLPYFDGRRRREADPPDDARLDAALALIRARTGVVTLVGLAGFAVLLWLMLARPGA